MLTGSSRRSSRRSLPAPSVATFNENRPRTNGQSIEEEPELLNTPLPTNGSDAKTTRSTRRQTIGAPSRTSTPLKTVVTKDRLKDLASYSSAEEDEELNQIKPPDAGLLTRVKGVISKRVTLPRPTSVLTPKVPSSGQATDIDPLVRKPLRRLSARHSIGVNTPNASRRATTNTLNSLSDVSSAALSSNLANFSDSEGENDFETSPLHSARFSEVSFSDSARDRLLKLRRRKPQSRESMRIDSITTQSDEPYDSEANRGWFSYFLPTTQAGLHNYIPHVLLALIVLFFAIITGVYWFKVSKVNEEGINFVPPPKLPFENEADLFAKMNTPLCADIFKDPSKSDEEKKLCLNSNRDIKPAHIVIREIVNLFESQILNYHCGDEEFPPTYDPATITIQELRSRLMPKLLNTDFFSTLATHDENKDPEVERRSRITRSISDALTLIQVNPKIKMTVIKDLTTSEPIEIKANPSFPVNYPWSCKIRRWVYNASIQLIVYTFVILTAWFLYKVFNQRKESEKREESLYYDLIEKSTEILQSPDEPKSMCVLHIRDTLITAVERKNPLYMRAWDRVVKFIESNDSRVKVDVENIEGEPFKTWKWVASPSTTDGSPGSSEPVLRTGNIEWQGQAFNEQSSDILAGSKNLTATQQKPDNFRAPTPFLKVRHMFDADITINAPVSWKNDVRSAILQKCRVTDDEASHGILHMNIDDRTPAEGLVYMRCKDIDAASNVFLKLHGWWCEKRLVSVRFLKDNRYYSRFPDAKNATEPLRLQIE